MDRGKVVKIVNIGAHKTGSVSLTALMVSIGYKSLLSDEWYFNRSYQDEVKNGDYGRIYTYLGLNYYDFFADSPYNLNDIYKWLKDVKFILTIREPESWYDSFLRWADKNPYVNSDESDVVFGYGARILEYNRRTIIKRYNKRNNDILRYFKGDICVINTSDTDIAKLNKISNLIGKEVNKSYPHKNKTI